MLMDAQLTNCNHTDPASQVLTSSREILILPQPTKDLDQSLSRRSTPPSPQLQPSKPLLILKGRFQSMFPSTISDVT